MSEYGKQSGNPRRILVADDNADSASSMGMLLEMMGHEVRVVNNGATAVQTAVTFLPDIVLLDIGMPQLNGYDTCSHIRQQSANKDMLIVALTGWTRDDMKQRAHQAGFDFYLIKPVEIPTLEKLLQGKPGSA